MLKRIVLLGAPGCGKGTQSVFLVNNYSLRHISVGDILRQNLKDKTELGRKIENIMSSGGLVSDEIICELISDCLSGCDSFLLDGFPRTLPQAEMLNEVLKAQGSELDAVIYLDVAKDLIISRLTGRRTCRQCKEIFHIATKPPKVEGKCDNCGGSLVQREDDTEKTATARLDVYFKETEPLVDFYNRAGRLIRIDGTQDIDVVSSKIKKALEDDQH